MCRRHCAFAIAIYYNYANKFRLNDGECRVVVFELELNFQYMKPSCIVYFNTRKINIKYTNIHDNDDATRKYTIGYCLSSQINQQNHFTHCTSNNLKF